MNASNLISIMNMEYKPSEKCLQTLQNMIADNPWFSIGQQLLAKEIQRLEKPDFENYLSMAAIHSLNRKFLYDRLFDSTQIIKNNVELQNFNIEEEPSNEKPEMEKQAIFDYPVVDYFANQIIEVNETAEDVIDKFLASSQKISMTHKDEKHEDDEITENIDVEPIVEDDFVTETLAKIYAEQGYISKAIEVYEKLSLQDSKKSVYFAALIENLKKRN
jgi:tetratricopeptide (TPR) repeat protein